MFVTKKELAVEIGEVDGVKVDDVDFTKAGKDEILQYFAPNTTSADHKYSRLERVS